MGEVNHPLGAAILSRLEYQHESLKEYLKVFSEEDFGTHKIPGKWSALENIAHLVTYQPVFTERVNLIRTTVDPLFSTYRADDQPDFIAASKMPLAALLTRLDEDRRSIFLLLEGMPPAEYERVGIHPKYGRYNIRQWTEFFLLHEAHHLFTIFKLMSTTE